MSPRTLGYLQVAIAAVLWGSIGVASRYGFAEGATPYAMAAWRGFLGFLGILAYALVTGLTLRIERRYLALFLAWGVFGIAIFYVIYMEAIARTSVATAAILLYTAPAFVAAISGVALREPMTRRKTAAIGLGFLGVVLVARGYDPASLRVSAAGLLAGIGSGLAYALSSIFAKVAVQRYPPATTLAYALGIGSILLMAAGLPSGAVGVSYPMPVWWAIAYTGLVTTAVAPLLFASGLRHVEATRASVVATVEPVSAAVLALVLLGERLEPLQVLGGALVLAAAALVQTDATAAG